MILFKIIDAIFHLDDTPEEGCRKDQPKHGKKINNAKNLNYPNNSSIM